MLPELRAFVESLAADSASVILPYFQAHTAVENKGDGSPVTVADREAEAALREAIMIAYPDHGIIGEEYGTHLPEADYQWVIDPIDGTKNFVAGTPMFGTLIGLMHHHKPILGAINFPVLGHLLLGDGQSTTLNGKAVHLRACHSLEEATLLCTDHWNVANYHSMPAYESLTRRARLYRTWGDCYGYYLLATGHADIMLDPIMNLWDTVALIPIIEGAGGILTDWYGDNPLKGQGVVASNAVLHDALIHALAAG